MAVSVAYLAARIYDSEDSQFQFLGRLHNATIDHNMTAEESETLLRRIEFIHVQHDLPAGIPSDRKEYKPI